MAIEGYYLLPHPPIVIPEVGKGEEEKIRDTSNSMDTIAKEIAGKCPDTIIIVSPHGPMFGDAIALTYQDELAGSLSNFGAGQVNMKLKIDKAFTNKLFELSARNHITSIRVNKDLLRRYDLSPKLDHGTMVPLYFINKYYKNYNLVHITYAPFADIDLYKFGSLIRDIAEQRNRKTVFIASGDLSHKLKKDGPYPYSPYGEKFDKEFLQGLEKGDVRAIFNMDKGTISNAGECGRRSVLMLLGALDGYSFTGDLLSYQGTFAVGYGIMRFNIKSEANSRLVELEDMRKKVRNEKLNQKDPYVRLTRESLTYYLTKGKKLQDLPPYVTEEMLTKRRGVFVSLKKHGDLRGCIGTFLATKNSIAEEIINNAIEAGINDPRFSQVEEEELLDIDFSVDVLEEPSPAKKSELDPKRYGVIVSAGYKRGLLLPDLEGVDTVEEQLSIACQKAGIGPREDYSIEKFEVIRHKEE
ncbi:MAG TPA: AMMECR1 domain-containing protein [Clostridium sp.]|nr:AMMECR1 domain-containing protein [Clostridium sp.]